LGERGVIDQVAFHPVTRTLLYDGPRRVPAELRVAADSRGREPVRGSTRPTVDPTGIWQVAPRPGADLVRARAGGRGRALARRGCTPSQPGPPPAAAGVGPFGPCRTGRWSRGARTVGLARRAVGQYRVD
jgi:hypothetical protein